MNLALLFTVCIGPLEVEFLVRISQKNNIQCRIFINFHLLSLIFEVKKSGIYFQPVEAVTNSFGFPQMINRTSAFTCN